MPISINGLGKLTERQRSVLRDSLNTLIDVDMNPSGSVPYFESTENSPSKDGEQDHEDSQAVESFIEKLMDGIE